MTLNKMFVKSKIQKKNGVYIVVTTYSYYYLYHYQEVEIYSTLEEAQAGLLQARCSGHLVIDVGDSVK